MCGISGIILAPDASAAERELSRAQTQLMMEALQHRGPDSQQLYSAPHYPAWLAHNRLSIIDLSQAGIQPMASSCGRYVVTYNGELYNYKELKDQLESRGVKFTSHSDTEVILQSYIEFGNAALKHMRGMFAFVIWDNTLQSAFVARDAFGIKPLYYAHTPQTGKFAFASELGALRLALENPTLDSNAIYAYLRTGSIAEPHTLVAQASLLPAGHYMQVSAEGIEINQYYSQPLTPTVASVATHSDAVCHLRSALESTIAAHFVSDVPVGLFLSGGIDSTVLLALASQYYQQQGVATPIKTYSITFADPHWNEGHIAAKTAAHFGSDHTEWQITKAESRALFNDYLEAVDQPSIDGFNTFCVSKLAHESGLKVVLSGLGGDELFAGYPSFKQVPRLRRAAMLALPLWPLIALVRALAWRAVSPRVRRLMDILFRPWSKTAAYYGYRAIYSEQEARCIQQQLGLPTDGQRLNTNLGTEPSLYEFNAYMRNQLLRDSDAMSMAWSLELRVPFVDRDFFESSLKIAPNLRLLAGKQLLIDAVPELPSWVIEQPKRGFQFPFDEWLGEDWRKLHQPIRWPNAIKPQPWYRQWAITVLDACCLRLGITLNQNKPK